MLSFDSKHLLEFNEVAIFLILFRVSDKRVLQHQKKNLHGGFKGITSSHTEGQVFENLLCPFDAPFRVKMKKKVVYHGNDQLFHWIS